MHEPDELSLFALRLKTTGALKFYPIINRLGAARHRRRRPHLSAAVR